MVERQERTHEQSINDALGEVLGEMRKSWTVGPERIGALHGSGRADVLVLDETGWPVAIEAKVANGHADAEQSAVARLGQRPVESAQAIESVVALVYPESLMSPSGGALREAIRETDEFEYALYARTEGNGRSRLPVSGWIRGDVIDLAMLVRRAAVPPPRVTSLANELSDAVDEAVILYGFPFGSEHGNALGAVIGQEDDRFGQTRRMAMVVLLNALVFHEALADCRYQVTDRDGSERPVRTLDEFWPNDRFFDRLAMMAEWRAILERNYWPVFHTALQLIDPRFTHLAQPRVSNIMDRLRQSASELTRSGFMRSHDLTGTVLQRLIADRNFLATYYTRPPAAALLAGLALPTDRPLGGSDWADAETLAGVQIGDFACGTGTLLSAAYSRLSLLHEFNGGDARELHGKMMENGLFGIDVLPTAVHLTATMLAGTHPDAPFDGERLMTMDYGSRGNGNVAVGSLELLAREVQPEMIEEAIALTSGRRSEGEVRDVVNHVGHGKFDLVIMNPPFVRNTNHETAEVPLPAYAAFETSPETQRLMSDREKRLARDSPASGHAGLASFFTELAYRKVRPDGTIAEVLPLSALSGQSWEATRKRWRSEYRDIVAVTIAGAGSHESSFSDDTGIAECLVVASRTPDPPDSPRGVFAVLTQQPDSPTKGELIASAIQRAIRDGVRQLDDGPLGTTPIMIGDEYCGYLLDCPLPESGPWTLAGVGDLELAQTAYHVRRGSLPTVTGDAHPLPVAEVGEVAKVGPVDRNIGSPTDVERGAFRITASRAAIPNYPALWWHDAARERRLIVEPDAEGAPFDADKAAKMWATATRAHYNRDLQFNAQSLVVAMTERPCLGGRAWPSIIFDDPAHEYAFALWANSTLGLLMHWWMSNKSQSGRGTTTVTGIPRFPTLDVRALSAERHARARDAFAALRAERFLPFDQIAGDEARARLDRALLVDVLGLPESLCAEDGPLDTLRRKLAAEPQIHGGKKSRVEFTDEGEVLRKKKPRR